MSQNTKTYAEQLQDITALYREAGEAWPATARQIAIWAINNGHYHSHRSKIIAKAAEEFADAMREVFYTDPQGRRVRVLHAARVARNQGTFWDDIRTADHGFMERAFQMRRRQIVGECRQLKNDVDSYNDNHPEQPNIQLVLNFMEDMAEMEQATEYRPLQPR